MDDEKYHLQGTKRLARFVVHRMNNLLGGIIGYSEIMLRHTQKDTDNATFLGHMHKVGLDASDMLAQFYTYLHLWDRIGDVAFIPLEMLQKTSTFMHSIFPMMDYDIQETPSPYFQKKQQIYADQQFIIESLVHIMIDITHLSNANTPTNIRFLLNSEPDSITPSSKAPKDALNLFLVIELLPPKGFSYIKTDIFTDKNKDENIAEHVDKNIIYDNNYEYIHAHGGHFRCTPNIPPSIMLSFPVRLAT